ncbi:murein hydrolase activator EnvC family protein [Parerythrobacter jejuensis]|uniref:Peptidoglycan DD-metalloendopeptidase family protein n=1 Tax=Parerythrobacter jejuensis TaxID=795812 RepID=A0A845AS03_9SPHN|nr:peptidoglycan DD-metalloendopeptidase family protein [Parerythrobacter jejuensis]MXP30902.1 peptidoglycan DD-metalloendopeptidase family protein [Parerythrobacter jejuensis]MXP33662.1 peptidoglycan DD-metalloendopeptidase family protein [Parerythrobacter jejuensis]
MTRYALPFLSVAFVAAGVGLAMHTAGVMAQSATGLEDPNDIRASMARAQAQAAEAASRGAELEQAARLATQEAEKTAQEAAALAARIQESEAKIGAAEARIGLIESQRQQLVRRLAERREPLVRLTGALQKFARRPLGLSILRPGSLRETVYLRAMLETTIPQVRARTAALRAEIDRGRALEGEARQAVAALNDQQEELGQRRQRLAAVETRQRIESRQRSGDAARETERALALAEEARDLGGLIDRLGEAGSLRDELAALPGPILRPNVPAQARVAAVAPTTSETPTSGAGLAPVGLQLPVTGQTLLGFGSISDGGVRNEGVTLSPRAGAQVIAPAAGRVAFAGPYRGFGRIVIIEHGAGWTSLITGLARTDVDVGEELVGGGPLGVAGVDQPEVTLELRRAGEPVNPLDFIG